MVTRSESAEFEEEASSKLSEISESDPSEPDAAAIRVDFGQTNLRRLAIGLTLLCCAELLLVVSIVAPGVFGSQDASWIIWFLAIFFGVILGLVLAALPAMLRRPVMAFDEHGVWWLDRATNTAISWNEVGAIGIGTLRSPWGGKRMLAWLELYPAEPAFASRRPELSLFRTVAEPPVLPAVTTELSEYRYRFPLTSYPKSGDQVREAVHHYRETVWVGEYVKD